MKPRTELSMQLYDMLLERGYHEELCDVITKNLNTDYTAATLLSRKKKWNGRRQKSTRFINMVWVESKTFGISIN